MSLILPLGSKNKMRRNIIYHLRFLTLVKIRNLEPQSDVGSKNKTRRNIISSLRFLTLVKIRNHEPQSDVGSKNKTRRNIISSLRFLTLAKIRNLEPHSAHRVKKQNEKKYYIISAFFDPSQNPKPQPEPGSKNKTRRNIISSLRFLTQIKSETMIVNLPPEVQKSK